MKVLNPIQPDDGDPRHGTYGGYSNHRCRCPNCREANAQFVRAIRTRRMAEGLPPDDQRHGTPGGYGNYGCRCRLCTTAWSSDSVARKRRSRTKT